MQIRRHILDICTYIVEGCLSAAAQVLLHIVIQRNFNCFVPEIVHSQAGAYKYPGSYELRGSERPAFPNIFLIKGAAPGRESIIS